MIKRGKKSQSNIIVIVLIILIILVLLVILWNIVMGLIKQNQSTIEVQEKIRNTQIIVDHKPKDSIWQNPGAGPNAYINLTVSRGKEELSIIDEQNIITQLNQKAEIISVVDISGSMALPVESACYGAYQVNDNVIEVNPAMIHGTPITRAQFCVGKNAFNPVTKGGSFCCYEDTDPLSPTFGDEIDCEDVNDCAKIHQGQLINDPLGTLANPRPQICKFNEVLPPTCITDPLFPHLFPDTFLGCAECGKSSKSYWTHKCSFSGTLPGYVDAWCGGSQNSCENLCNGNWEVIISDTKEYGYCLPKPEGCCDPSNNDCTSEVGCKTCFSVNGGAKDNKNYSINWDSPVPALDGICKLWQYENACCNNPGIECITIEADCNACSEEDSTGGFQFGTISDEKCIYNSMYPSTTPTFRCEEDDREITRGLGFDYSICEGSYCKGEYRAKRRIDFTKAANINFVSNIFSSSPGNNRISIVEVSDVASIYPLLPKAFYEDNAADITEINLRINNWITKPDDLEKLDYSLDFVALNLQKTFLCQGFVEARDRLINEGEASRYKVIVLMSDGITNIDCSGAAIDTNNPIEVQGARDELINLANLAHDNNNIHTYTIGISNNADILLLQPMVDENNGGNGTFVSSINMANLNDLYSQIAFRIQEDTLRIYTSQEKWDFIRSVVTGTDPGTLNPNSVCTRRVSSPIPRPLETKKIEVPTCGFTDIQKIELHLVAFTDDGREVSKLLDSIVR
ncbi:VWA domain-containing protein [Candidatus Pacearchaeota archaeon]|nr:VWA domain-containing protein [Candidatus Pacearchaeota archaeon]